MTGQMEPHILIIGAGITGLTLAQALKTQNIPFTVFERDADPFSRGRGWGLTIHWALDTFLSLLPQQVIARLPECYVDPVAVEEGENGKFLLFDLNTGEPKWQVPAARRMRWSHSLQSITYPDPDTATALFSNSVSATGTLIIGADGSHSAVRSHLLSHDPSLAKNSCLPVRFLGVSTIFPPTLALEARALDPFFFQGGDPQKDTFLYFSFLDTPSKNERLNDEGNWECQIIISYPYRSDFWGKEEPMEVPETHKERVALMKEFADGWANPFRSLILAIPDETEVKALPIEDFVPKEGMWDNAQGRVTMVGDAAHAMTMYRGEAANHGITDVSILLSHLLPPFAETSKTSNTNGLKKVIDAYEREMMTRTGPAVLTSRRACLDAHDYKKITDKSPLVSRRAIVFEA
ncbi:FAD-dependent monooxygenase [Physcia stellaris]|nr:FAD-dependent monooxygenase [Physcia stellaris]